MKPPKPLTTADVAKLLKARRLKATAEELPELTRMMNADLEREAGGESEAEKARAYLLKMMPNHPALKKTARKKR